MNASPGQRHVRRDGRRHPRPLLPARRKNHGQALAEAGVAGERLVFTGPVLRPDCKTPVVGASIDFWHCDHQGADDIKTPDEKIAPENFHFRARQQIGSTAANRLLLACGWLACRRTPRKADNSSSPTALHHQADQTRQHQAIGFRLGHGSDGAG